MIDPKLKQFCRTDSDKRIIEAVISQGSHRKAAKHLTMSSRTVDRCVARVKKLGEKQGYSPEHGLFHPSPEHIPMSGYSHIRRDAEGNMLGWDKYKADDAKLLELLQETVEALKEDLPVAPRTKLITKNQQADLLNLYVVTDYHLGMLSWAEETGADWDMDIAEDLLIQWFTKAIARSPDASEAIFAQLGDFLHFDSLDAVTPEHGNILDADTRFQKLVRVAIRVIRRVIAMLLEKYPKVIVLMAEGNHDPASSIWLRELFAAHYDNEPRVVVDVSVDPYYCYEFGYTSLFFHHGHKRKVSNIDTVFASKYREIFGRTKHSYAHMGHRHSIDMKETNLMVVEQHRTLAAADAYAARGGWMSGRDASVITYHRQYGYDSRVVLSAEAAIVQ